MKCACDVETIINDLDSHHSNFLIDKRKETWGVDFMCAGVLNR